MITINAARPIGLRQQRLNMDKELIFQATKKDFKLDWFSGSGAGGQHRNKHQNCLRLTHIPSGITVTSQTLQPRVCLKSARLQFDPQA